MAKSKEFGSLLNSAKEGYVICPYVFYLLGALCSVKDLKFFKTIMRSYLDSRSDIKHVENIGSRPFLYQMADYVKTFKLT